MRSQLYARDFSVWLLALVWLASGCQTFQLRVGSINQARSYGDIQEQQVLDNLAKFVYDINSLPSFAYSAQGTNQVQDQVSISSTTTWQRIAAGLYGWMSSTAVPGAQRQAFQNWILQPLNDPRKLDLMRCAYQKVVRDNLAARGLSEAGSCSPCEGGVCPDCAKRFNTFYTGKATVPPPPPGDPKDTGVITHLCLGHNPVWFAWGCKKNLPIHCRCLKWGHYCGTYVWVLPGGEDELTKLTLAILDYAVNAPTQRPTKQVTYYVGKNDMPTTQKDAVGTVTGILPMDVPSKTLLRADLEHAANVHQDRILNDKSLSENTRKTLADRHAELMRDLMILPTLPDLPAPYRPSIDELTGPNLLQLQFRLQGVLPNQAPSLAPPP